MNCKVHILLCFFFVFYSTDAFNITKILDDHPDFSTFNSFLTQTQLAAAINARQTITVLAVDNGNMGSLSGKPADVLKNIMSVHVILEYYGEASLKALPKRTRIVTTLFQSTGKSIGQQGFLNITDTTSGVSLGSAANGATLGSTLVGSVLEEPYNISVLQVSSPIIPAGIESINSSETSPPAPSPKSPSPRLSPDPSMSPSLSPPSPTPRSSPPRPHRAPASSPPQPDDPAADTPTADAPTADKAKNAGATLRLSLGAVFMIVSSAISVIW